MGARLRAVRKYSRQKREEHSFCTKLAHEDHELLMKLARDDHNDKLQKRQAEQHTQIMENLKARKALIELKMKLLEKQNN